MRAGDAITRLREGNCRFVAGQTHAQAVMSPAKRAELASGQHPFATVLGCSDSRVPVEAVFDQGVGDLFVVRVAGNVAGPLEVGSIELAAVRLGVRLVVVLGHSDCGAIKAALDELRHPKGGLSPGLRSIVDGVRPAIERALAAGSGSDVTAVIDAAVRANIRAAAGELRDRSDVLRELIRTDGLVVVGAEYSLATGEVDFFDSLHEGL